MVDKFCYAICLLLLCFSCMFVGWLVGFADAKKRYKGRAVGNEQI